MAQSSHLAVQHSARGRAYEHQQAARAVRDALAGPPLTRLTLREQAHTLRAAVNAAVTIGELQAIAVRRVANRGGLWIAHERPNLRPPGVERRRVKHDWEIMDGGHPAARVLADRGHLAEQVLAAAAEAANRAVLPSAARHGETGRIALVEDRIVAGWWETVEPPAQTRNPEDCDAMKSQSVSPTYRSLSAEVPGFPTLRSSVARAAGQDHLPLPGCATGDAYGAVEVLRRCPRLSVAVDSLWPTPMKEWRWSLEKVASGG